MKERALYAPRKGWRKYSARYTTIRHKSYNKHVQYKMNNYWRVTKEKEKSQVPLQYFPWKLNEKSKKKKITYLYMEWRKEKQLNSGQNF